MSLRSAVAVIEMTAEGATVPFMARYRKEKTGNLDEVQIRSVVETHEEFQEVVKRKAFLLKEIGEQGNLTEVLQKRIETCWDLGELEEIYRPFKKKKKTKATLAREAGLEDLANWIWDLGHGKIPLTPDTETLEVRAKKYLNVKAGIASYDLALKGVQDILVEKITNEPELRDLVLKSYFNKGRIVSERAKGYKANSKYEMYEKYDEPVSRLLETKSSHRYLAMRRGWQEEELSLKIVAEEDELLRSYEVFSTTLPDQPVGDFLKACAKQALLIYVIPSVTNEVHRALKEKADKDSIQVFSENVRKLLLASPFGSRVVLGVDPGLRTGCKMALVDKSGAYVTHTVLQILGEDAFENAKKLFGEALKQIQVEAIAVGNGTAGRQTEVFLRKVLKELGKEIPVVMVNESGASVYSASDIARQEFPDLDVTVRGAISIARRLQDPLAELVKVDPKSIGVGQYQHDVSASGLKKSLDAVVESCVNGVGVDLNTASAPLLSYVSGIGPSLATAIVEHRKSYLFGDRSELLKVPRFSTKVYEQAAGFLRIANGKVFLDSTGIHPERYPALRDMAQELGINVSELVGEGAKKLLTLKEKWTTIIGEFTFLDIVKELEKPGRDPRDPFKAFSFRDDIFEVKDLKEGMICPGIVTNVTNFGAFVDIGVHQDGLVHISELSNKFIDDPRKVVNPGDMVTVRVLKVDQAKNQISLSMKMEVSKELRVPRSEQNVDHRPQKGSDQRSGHRRPEAGRSAGNGGGSGPQRGGARPPSYPAPGSSPGSSHGSSTATSRSGSKPGGGGHSPRPGQQRSGSDNRRPSGGGTPFNNPFAALGNLKK